MTDTMRDYSNQYNDYLDEAAGKDSEGHHSKKNGEQAFGSTHPQVLNPSLIRPLSHHQGDCCVTARPPPKIIPLNRKRPPMPVPMPPLPPLPPANGTSETGSDLYEGLKRMTRGRLDDQRGTEINNELPEFLRKPGGQPPDSRVSEPFRLEQGSRPGPPSSMLSGPAGYLGRKCNITSQQSSNIPSHPGIQSSEGDKEHAKHYIDYIDSTFTSEGHVPNMAEAEEVSLAFNLGPRVKFTNDIGRCLILSTPMRVSILTRVG